MDLGGERRFFSGVTSIPLFFIFSKKMGVGGGGGGGGWCMGGNFFFSLLLYVRLY